MKHVRKAINNKTDFQVNYLNIERSYGDKNSAIDKLCLVWKCISLRLITDVNETALILKAPALTKKRSLRTDLECTVSVFSTCAAECHKFTTLLTVIKFLISNLTSNKQTTRRDLYYQDVALFKRNQNISNKTLSMISSTLSLSEESELKIHASQKGLAFGDASCYVKGREILTLEYSQDPQLIPFIGESDNLEVSSERAVAIVVLEKESVFKAFCNYIKLHKIPFSLIVITGKGYPDALTKRFVSLLSKSLPSSPILGFMDSDVFGLHICKNYKYGNKKIEREWCKKMEYSGVFLLDYHQGWLDLPKRDFKMILNFISDTTERMSIAPNLEMLELKKWHRELTRSLVLMKKSEMNVMNGDSLQTYILEKVSTRMAKSSNQMGESQKSRSG